MSDWIKHQTIHQGIGTLCEVFINKKEMLIRRNFYNESSTVNGAKTRFSEDEIINFFKNEVYWLEKLESRWLPKTIEVNTKNRYIIQEYYNEDLLHHRKKLHQVLPDIDEQIIEMYEFFKAKNVFKRNGSLSNLTWNESQLVAFDFKWSTERPDGLDKEIYSYDYYLSKVDISLPEKLKAIIKS